MSRVDEYKVDLPEGVSGDWRVERFTISKDEASLECLRMTFGGQGYRAPLPGKYTRLMYRGGVVMSDTHAEMRDHLPLFFRTEQAGGLVRIHGLGLGMAAAAVLKSKKVERVDVVEVAADVIKLVAPTLSERYGPRFNLIEGDARELKPNGVRYAAVWHDIWPAICGDYYAEMKFLHRRWARSCDWQESWCRAEMRRHARESY